MGAGKSVASILMAIMRDKQLLDYDKPVCHYWPEFAQNGKDKITVSDVLRNEAGLFKLHKPIETEKLLTNNIRANEVGRIIEEDTPEIMKDGLIRNYHGYTRDLITNEIFRRIEPDGLTMG